MLRSYRNNANILGEINWIVHEIHNSSNLAVAELKVTGRASPKDSYNHNVKLPENRALTLVGYLRDRGGIDGSLLAVDWRGEGWTGLRDEVIASRLNDKETVFALINGGTGTTQRKNRL